MLQGRVAFFALFFYLYAYYPSEAGKGWKAAIHTWFTAFKVSSFFRKLFLLVFVTSMILFRTLLNRDLWMNPLSDVMGGWGIWETVNGERQLTTECIENVILMMPFTGMVMWTFDVEKGVVWKSTKLGYQSSTVLDEPEREAGTTSIPIPQCEESENIPLPDLSEQPENVQRPGSEVVEKGLLT